MSLSGHVENGVVVFDAGAALPEGTKVSVVPAAEQTPAVVPGNGDWEAALEAVRNLEAYDFDAWQRQRACDFETRANSS